MSTIRAVFFDLDDTLCDAKTAFSYASEAAFGAICARHPHLTEAQVRSGWRDVHIPLFADLAAGRLNMSEVRLLRFRRLLTLLGETNDAFADETDLLLGRVQLDLLTLFGGFTATVDELRRRGLHVGIITNGAGDLPPDSQRSKAERLGLLGRVNSFWVSDVMGYRKPDPRAFLPALGAANCQPSDALYVGDSLENDVAGANRAGLVSVLLAREVFPDSFSEARPRHMISSVAETLNLVT